MWLENCDWEDIEEKEKDTYNEEEGVKETEKKSKEEKENQKDENIKKAHIVITKLYPIVDYQDPARKIPELDPKEKITIRKVKNPMKWARGKRKVMPKNICRKERGLLQEDIRAFFTNINYEKGQTGRKGAGKKRKGEEKIGRSI